MTHIQSVKKLNNQERKAIQQLISDYQTTQGWHFKLDPNTFENNETQHTSHFLVKVNGRLTAYMLTTFFNQTELEVTMVGIDEHDFASLLSLALTEADKNKLSTILLAIDPSDRQTVSLAKKNGMNYDFSEFRLALTSNTPPLPSRPELSLRQATANDKLMLDTLDLEGFGEPSDISTDEISLYQIAEVNRQIIGKVKLEESIDTVGIFGFVVSSAERGKGYGTEILARIIQEKQATGFSYIYLEVALANSSALKLYEKSGFEKEATFDYYQLKITPATKNASPLFNA